MQIQSKIRLSVWLTLSLFLTILSAEIAARVYLKHFWKKATSSTKFQFDSYRIYAHRPGFIEGDWLKINGQGFRRSKEVHKIKSASTFRVFLLGGSAAHGTSSQPPYPIRQIHMNETIDAYLEKMLQEKYPHWTFEIINAAVTGYELLQHTSYILSELADYSPDLIIFFDGANDHYTTNSNYDSYRDNHYQFWKGRLQHPSVGGVFDLFALLLSEHSALMRGYFMWRLREDFKVRFREAPMLLAEKSYNDERLVDLHKKAAQSQFIRNMEINLVVLQHFKVKAILVLQTMLVLREEKYLSQQEKSFMHRDESTKILYPAVRDEVAEIAGKYGVPFVDMIPVFNSLAGRQLLIDYAHLTPEGSEVAARALLPEVEKIFVQSTGASRGTRP